MSIMCINEISLGRALNGLISLSLDDCHLNYGLEEIFHTKLFIDQLKKFGQDIINQNAAEYSEKYNYEIESVSFNLLVEKIDIYQVIKTLKFARYQLETDISKGSRDKLTKIIDLLVDKVLTDSPEYKSAQWG